MSLGTDIVHTDVLGASKVVLVDYTTDGSYSSGGYALDEGELGLQTITAVIVGSSSAGFIGVYVPSTGKLKVLKGAAGVNVQAADNEATLASEVFSCVVIGDPSPIT